MVKGGHAGRDFPLSLSSGARVPEGCAPGSSTAALSSLLASEPAVAPAPRAAFSGEGASSADSIGTTVPGARPHSLAP
jgi:hypothetical protein